MDKQSLLMKMRGINDWIAENPDTDPNMYQMIECVTSISVLEQQGEDVTDLKTEWKKMYAKRFSDSRRADPTFSVCDETELSKYFHDIQAQCLDGNFRYPGMEAKTDEERKQTEAERNEFLECLRKIGSVSLYINQQKLQNPDFVYDNEGEYQDLIGMAERYKEYLPESSHKLLNDMGMEYILKDSKEKLMIKMRRTNDWIAENPDTDPNMYQMIEYLTELGIIAREEGVAERPNKFPEPGSELVELYSEWNKIYKARLSLDKVRQPNFSVNQNTALYAYFTDLHMRCLTGEFRYPGMDAKDETEKQQSIPQRKEFLECVRRMGSVSLYINQQRAQNPNFVYDNQSEYANLADMAERYEEYLPAYSTKVLENISASRVLSQPDNPGADDEPSL